MAMGHKCVLSSKQWESIINEVLIRIVKSGMSDPVKGRKNDT